MKNLYLILILSLIGYCGYAQKFTVDTLAKTGPINRRINVVILGDGFTAAEMPKFIDEANKFKAYFLSYAPYNRYADYFSFFAIRTPSNESGATNLGKAPDAYPTQPVETKDTYYGCAFGTNTHRLVLPTKFSNVTNVLANNFPSYDLIIMISNSPWYGGSGGALAVYTLAASALNIAVHEVGHTFSALADEYWPGGGRTATNMSNSNAPATIKWKNWLNRENVGIFDHTGTGAAGWYKPTQANCLMELLAKQNCAVCRETTVDKILKLIKPIESNSPNATKTIFDSANQTFSVKLLKPNPNSLQVEWRIDGKLIDSGKEQISVARSQLDTKTATLTMSVFDSTWTTKTESTRAGRAYTVSWPLEKSDLPAGPAISTSKAAICVGESTTLTATGCTGTLAWSSGQTTASFSVTPTQTTTYTANCTVNGLTSEDAKVTITVNPIPDAKASNGGTVLEDATIQLSASGGTSYSWSGPANYASTTQNPTIASAQLTNAGTYTVKVSSAAGCSKEAQTTVNVGVKAPIITVNSTNICPNDKITLSTSSCASGTIKWSNGATGSSQSIALTQSTTFTAVCEKIGQSSTNSNSVVINVKAAVNGTATNKGPYFEGTTVELSSSGGSEYTWEGPNSFVSKEQNPTIANATVANSGTYTVTVKSAEGCTGTATTSVLVDKLLSTSPISDEAVNVFPNPACESITINFDKSKKGDKSLELIDNQGAIVIKKAVSESDFQLNLSELPAGTYFLRLRQGASTVTKKIVKR